MQQEDTKARYYEPAARVTVTEQTLRCVTSHMTVTQRGAEYGAYYGRLPLATRPPLPTTLSASQSFDSMQ